jgi:hypothetical protein
MDRELLERIDEELRLTREQHADYLREAREARRGYQLAIRQMNAVVQENSDVIREAKEEMRESRRSLRDMREEIRANTKAVLALLDRFENGGASPATG